MLRRSAFRFQSLNKGAINPGPTLHGWGRTVQKRRLEYETVESKYGKREFNKNWDLAGCLQRSTDFLEMRTYFNYPMTIFTWMFNSFVTLWAFWPTGAVMLAFHYWVEWHDANMKRAAWY